MKLLVVGIDGFDPDYLSTDYSGLGSASEVMPFLSSLRGTGKVDSEDGVPEGELEKERVPNSWQLWTDFATGQDLTMHGVKYARFSGEKGGSPEFSPGTRFWQATDLPQSTTMLFETLNSNGITVGWSRFPVSSYPPRPIDGWMISGSSGYPPSAWPQDVAQQFNPRHVPAWNEDRLWNLVSFEGTLDDVDGEDESFVASLEERRKEFVRTASYIEESYWDEMVKAVRNKPVDCVFHYMRHSDGVGHVLRQHLGLLGMFFRNVDSMIASFCEEFDPEHVIILSDHGMAPYSPEDDPDDWPTNEKSKFISVGDRYTRFVEGRKGFFAMEGRHSRYGVVAASQSCMASERGRILGVMGMRDFYPTICRLVGVAYDADKISGIPNQKFAVNPELAVEERLRALGYTS